ncbi:protein with 5 transmembrane domains [Cryptosporidium ryanae]|uniref:protein with 5 transmembrane domains n=1 Tax=Cryptosporidium ryanae TaxID=515981 RepID=UPI00351A8A0E|nr:protein with 5 transmembrane domains [Cryptosporidium ryanae]
MNNTDYKNHFNRKRDNGMMFHRNNPPLNKPLDNPFAVSNSDNSGVQSGSHGNFNSGFRTNNANEGRHQAHFYGWDNPNLNENGTGGSGTSNGVSGNNGFNVNPVTTVGGIRNNDISDNLFLNLGGGGHNGNFNNGPVAGDTYNSSSTSSDNGNSLSGYICNLNSNNNAFGSGFEYVSGKVSSNNETNSTACNMQSFTSQFEKNNSTFGMFNLNSNTASQLVMGIVSSTVKETAGLNPEKISQLQLWFPQTIASLKSHFVVSHEYVLKKLLFMIFPFIVFFTHENNMNCRALSYENYQNSISSCGESDMRTLPTLFSDLYIPLMGFITYVLADGVINGVFSQFKPQILGSTASFSIVLLITEIILFQLGSYIFAGRVLTTLDLFSSMGYKYTSIVLCDLILLFIGGRRNHIFWFFFIYISLSSSLVVYLMLKVISNHNLSNQYSMIQQSGLTFVILIFSIFQVPLCWILLPSV